SPCHARDPWVGTLLLGGCGGPKPPLILKKRTSPFPAPAGKGVGGDGALKVGTPFCLNPYLLLLLPKQRLAAPSGACHAPLHVDVSIGLQGQKFRLASHEA